MRDRPLGRIDLSDETEMTNCYLQFDQVQELPDGPERDAARLEWMRHWGHAIVDTLRPRRPL